MTQQKIKSKQPLRRLSGTREWAETNINIQTGCEHDCRYCYARYNAVNRFRRCSRADWRRPFIDNNKVDADYRKFPGQVMFPSSHDITPLNLPECLCVLLKLLDAGNQVIIVSKPHIECVKLMCERFRQYRRQIIFRFTIGSVRDDVLRFWEPNAPSFGERHTALNYAFDAGYATSVSCEPFLDTYPQYFYDLCKAYITDTFWLGLLRKFDQRVDFEGVTEDQIELYINPLKKIQADPVTVKAYYGLFKNKPYVKFKDSIREIIDND